MSSLGTHFFVQYDSCIPMFFDANDIAAIIVDKDPGAKDLVIGAQVVAKRPKETSYVEGKVVQTKEEKKEKLYLIDFWDGVEHWNTLDKIRILTTIKPGGHYVDLVQFKCFLCIGQIMAELPQISRNEYSKIARKDQYS